MERKKEYKTALVVLVIAVVIAALLTWLKPKARQLTPLVKPVSVKAYRIADQSCNITLESDGFVRAGQEVQLTAEVAGKIVETSKLFREGTQVKKGDLLLRLEDKLYRSNLEQAKARLKQAEIALAQEKVEVDIARTEFKDRKGVSQLALRGPFLEKAQVELEASKAQVEKAYYDLKMTEVRSPFDGVVNKQSVELGQFVNVGTLVGQIFGTNFAEIKAGFVQSEQKFLTELELSKLVAEVSWSKSSKTWKAAIVRISPLIDRNSRLINVFLKLADPLNIKASHAAGPIFPGTFVKVRIASAIDGECSVVPRSSVYEDSIFLIDTDKKLVQEPVKILRLEPTQAFLKHKLESGTLVLAQQIPNAVKGLSVSVLEE